MERRRNTRARKKRKNAGPGAIALTAMGLVTVAGGLFLGVQAYNLSQGFLDPAAARAQPARAESREAAPSPASTATGRKRTPARPAEEQPEVRVREGATVSVKSKAEEGAAGTEPGTPPQASPGAALRNAAAAVEPAGGATSVSPLPPIEIDRGTGHRPEVALTFDAGADYRPVKQILDALAAEGIKCTFFLTGEWVEKNPKTTRRIAEEGHEIGNHSWSHPDFTRLSDAEIRSQVRRTEALIQQTTGKSSRPYFRPPLGARDRRVKKLIGDEGFLTVYWTVDSHDSVIRDITAEQIRTRVMKRVAPGTIVLLHCGSKATADALPELLKGVRARGLQPVTVGQLLVR